MSTIHRRLAATAAAAFAAVSLTACLPSWPTWRGGVDGAGTNPAETAITSKTVHGLEPGWKLTVPAGNTFGRGPVAADGVIYLAAGPPATDNGPSTLFARNAATGALRWTHGYAGSVRPMGVDGGVLTIELITPELRNGELLGIDTKNGAQLWKVVATSVDGNGYGSAGGGRVYIAESDHLVALDAKTGRVLWRTPGCTPSAICDFSPTLVSYADEKLFVGGGQNYRMLVFDAKTGAVLWHALEPVGTLHSPYIPVNQPAVADGKVFVTAQDGTGGGELLVYPEAGCRAFSCRPTRLISGYSSYVSPTVVGGRVFLDGSPRGLVALDPATGRTLWSAGDIPDTGDWVGAGDVLFETNRDDPENSVQYTLHAYAAAGCGHPACSSLWTYHPAKPNIYGLNPPIVLGGRVFLTLDATLQTFQPS